MHRRLAFRLAAMLALGVSACAPERATQAPPVTRLSTMAAAIAAPAPPPEKGSEAGGPAVLRGLSPAEVKTMLGSPGFQRRDAPAEIWQYRGRGCTLDLFIYDGGSGQTVDHYAVRSAVPVADKDCFDALMAERRALSGS
jgi:hypothetical protein